MLARAGGYRIEGGRPSQKKRVSWGYSLFKWRTRRDSNPQPADSKSDALSIELRVRGVKLLYTRCIFRQFQARFVDFLKEGRYFSFCRLILGAILVQLRCNYSGFWCNPGAIPPCGAIESDALFAVNSSGSATGVVISSITAAAFSCVQGTRCP